MNNFKFAAAFALLTSNAAFADPSVYTPALSMDSNFTRLEDGTRIHSIEAGTGHTVVLLHGLPASAYLWRDVVLLVGQSNHAVAPDLPGYGYSSTLATGDFDLSSAADALAEYLDGVSAEKITLVVTDMGSVLGLNYAIKNPERIAGIVMSEAVFQPPEAFMAQIRPEHLEFIMAAQDPAFVKQITLDQPMLVDMAMQNNSVTELSEETLSNYRSPYYAPFEDHQEKRQTLNAVFGADGLQDFGVIAEENAVGLTGMNVPILLVVANPGYMVNAPAVAYARDTFDNLTVRAIEGAGHFFAEDNPEDFSEVVNEWLAEVKN